MQTTTCEPHEEIYVTARAATYADALSRARQRLAAVVRQRRISRRRMPFPPEILTSWAEDWYVGICLTVLPDDDDA